MFQVHCVVKVLRTKSDRKTQQQTNDDVNSIYLRYDNEFRAK